MAEDFRWQPAGGNRGAALWGVVALVVIAISALVGFALGNRFPISSLVEAIERNGVRSQIAANHAVPANPSRLEFPIPGPQRPAPYAMAPVVLNPGAAESSPEPARIESPERATAKETEHPRTAQRDRRVLVVVRRVGAPYDTKVLRGRIQGGRLVVDQRDRRGIIIR